MSLLYKNKIEIPDSLARSIRSICLDNIGLYDSVSHTFVGASFAPTQGRYEEIQSVMKLHEIDTAEVKGITALVLQNNRADASSEIVDKINVLGEKSLMPLTHIRISELQYYTDLLYLGNGRFFVVDTTRPTIIPDDILVKRKLEGNRWEFDIIRDGKKFIDDIFLKQNTNAWFKTNQINEIVKFHSPEVNSIIDSRPIGLETKNFSEEGLWELITEIQSSLAEISSDYFENNEVFPQYEVLVDFARQRGIPSYVLNILAQRLEKNEAHPYNFVRDDWEEHMTEKEKREREDARINAKCQNHYNLERTFEDMLKSIKVKKILFGLFEKNGSAANNEEMERIINELEADSRDDELKSKGAIKINAPKTQYDYAKKHSIRNKKKNWINGIIIGAIIAAAIFICVTWIMTKKGAERFNDNVSVVPELIQEAKYEEANCIVEDAYQNFTPSYMKIRVMVPHKRMLREIDAAIDKDVQEGIEQIKTILKATRGRFDKNTEEMLFRLLQLRPENEELLELKEIWKKS